MAEKTFITKVNKISNLFSSFKGFHKKVLRKPIKIFFKPTKDMKVRGKYKQDLDQIWVKQSSKVDNELYGHLLYIIRP